MNLREFWTCSEYGTPHRVLRFRLKIRYCRIIVSYYNTKWYSAVSIIRHIYIFTLEKDMIHEKKADYSRRSLRAASDKCCCFDSVSILIINKIDPITEFFLKRILVFQFYMKLYGTQGNNSFDWTRPDKRSSKQNKYWLNSNEYILILNMHSLGQRRTNTFIFYVCADYR